MRAVWGRSLVVNKCKAGNNKMIKQKSLLRKSFVLNEIKSKYMTGITDCLSAFVNGPEDRSSQKLKPQARLSQTQVVAIFQSRASNQSSTKVANSYGVNEKTVRDIWTGRTWAKETWHLDPSRRVEVKTMGRPIGCRDTKPRKQKGCKPLSQRASTSASADVEHHASKEAACQGRAQSIDEQLYEWEQDGLWDLSAPDQAQT